MPEADVLRQLATALDDIAMHMTLLALLPWTVHVDHQAARVEFERRASRERAARLAGIPVQRQRSPMRTDLTRRTHR